VHLGDEPVERFALARVGDDLVEDAELRIDARLDRVLAQETRAERVDRGDRGGLDVLARRGTAGSLQRLGETAPHLRRGLLGERDREDPPQVGLARRHAVDDAVRQHACLSRARARDDAEVDAVGLDRAALVVRELRLHASPS
jgi:hypothetical protein